MCCTLSGWPTLIFWFISDESLPGRLGTGQLDSKCLQFFINTITSCRGEGRGRTCAPRTQSLTPIKNCQALKPAAAARALNRMMIDDPGPDPRYHIIRQFSGQTLKMPPHSALVPVATEYQLLLMVPSLYWCCRVFFSYHTSKGSL